MTKKILLITMALASGFWITQDSLATPSPVATVLVARNDRVPAYHRRTPTRNDLATALRLARKKNYTAASERLFSLSYSPLFRSHRMKLKYILGLIFQKMGMPQLAAFQYITVIKEGSNRYIKQALERLSLVADDLGDDTLLNYAISRVHVADFPASHRDMLYYRIGEYQMRNNQYVPAARSFARVQPSSALFSSAKYDEGLAYAQAGQLNSALNAFDQLLEARKDKGVTDTARVDALMGRARVLYQAKKWDAAIAAYRDVPRDTSFWHETLFESSWAMLRSGRFRSALSNFHSLHSPYYEQTYQPESLLLRAIVYLYICKYDEMEKVLDLFARTYKPVYHQIDGALKRTRNPAGYFNTIARILRDYKLDSEKTVRTNYLLPYMVAQRISREGDFQSSYNYIRKLVVERRRIAAQPAAWRGSSIGRYATHVINTRITKAKEHAGREIKRHLERLHDALVDLFEQEGFIRYEMINGRKEELKKRIAGKELPDQQVDDNNHRSYYVQNGYEYWPFQGEYWLDELGNYHYVGTTSCH